MTQDYRPPSGRSGFYILGACLAVALVAALTVLALYSGMFMHGDP